MRCRSSQSNGLDCETQRAPVRLQPPPQALGLPLPVDGPADGASLSLVALQEVVNTGDEAAAAVNDGDDLGLERARQRPSFPVALEELEDDLQVGQLAREGRQAVRASRQSRTKDMIARAVAPEAVMRPTQLAATESGSDMAAESS